MMKKAFASHKTEIWCENLAFVDKLAKHDNVVKEFLVHQDLSDRTVDIIERKQKHPKKQFVQFGQNYQKIIEPKKFGLTREKNSGEFKTLCKLERIKVHSTKSETKVAFVERKIRSVKSIL